jgi:hypothetical protein
MFVRQASPLPNGGGTLNPGPNAPIYGPPAPAHLIRPNYVAYPNGTIIPTSRATLEAGFNRAGFTCGPVMSGPGMQYTNPATGDIYRVMYGTMYHPPRLVRHAPRGNQIQPDGNGIGHLRGKHAVNSATHLPLEP